MGSLGISTVWGRGGYILTREKTLRDSRGGQLTLFGNSNRIRYWYVIFARHTPHIVLMLLAITICRIRYWYIIIACHTPHTVGWVSYKRPPEHSVSYTALPRPPPSDVAAPDVVDQDDLKLWWWGWWYVWLKDSLAEVTSFSLALSSLFSPLFFALDSVWGFIKLWL